MEHSDKQVERFWAKVDKTTSELGCWLWSGGKNGYGYGRYRFVDRKYIPAHRISWFLAHPEQDMPENLDHKFVSDGCPRNCVNPEHLRPATKKQNAENRSVLRGASGVRGVTWHKKSGKWAAYVVHNNKTIYLGLFTDIKEAEKVVVAKRMELFTHNDHDRELVS